MEEDGTDRHERADSAGVRLKSGEGASVADKQKTLDATLFNCQHGSDVDQLHNGSICLI